VLVLTRRIGEVLRIGDDIEVAVLAVNGQQVRIGIKAPRNITVDREEVAERKQREHAANDASKRTAQSAEILKVIGCRNEPADLQNVPLCSDGVARSTEPLALPSTPAGRKKSTLRIPKRRHKDRS
jgi:carbon storage regulator